MMSEKSISIHSSVRTEPETILSDESLGKDFLFFDIDDSFSSRDCSYGNSFLNIIPFEITEDNALSVGSLGFQESLSSLKNGEKSPPFDDKVNASSLRASTHSQSAGSSASRSSATRSSSSSKRRQTNTSSFSRTRRERSSRSSGPRPSGKSGSPARHPEVFRGSSSSSSKPNASDMTVASRASGRCRRRTGRSPTRPGERVAKPVLKRSVTSSGQSSRSTEERIQRREAFRRAVSVRDVARKASLSPRRTSPVKSTPQPRAFDTHEGKTGRSSSLTSRDGQPRCLSQPRRLPRCNIQRSQLSIQVSQLSQTVHSNVVDCVDDDLEPSSEEAQMEAPEPTVDPTFSNNEEGSGCSTTVARDAVSRKSVLSPFLKVAKTTGKSAAKACTKVRAGLTSFPSVRHKEGLSSFCDDDDQESVASFA